MKLFQLDCCEPTAEEIIMKDETDADLVDINEWVPYRMWRMGWRAASKVRDLCQKEYGIKPSSWRALANIASSGPISVKELSEEIGLDLIQTSRAVDRLARKKLVTRRTDKSDRRRVELRLSKKGWEVYRSITPLLRQLESTLLNDLSKKEVEQFTRILSSLDARAAMMRAEG